MTHRDFAGLGAFSLFFCGLFLEIMIGCSSFVMRKVKFFFYFDPLFPALNIVL